MKYGGTINIIDDEGNIVFERELSADEMIEELLRAKSTVYETSADLKIGPIMAPGSIHAFDDSKPARAPRKCGTCGKSGHTYKKCPDRGQDVVKQPKAPKPVEPAMPKKDTEALTEKEYGDVQDAKKDDLASLDAAHELDLPLVEVNKAYGSPTYEHYLFNR